MRILLEINHPAQLHMFRPVMKAWSDEKVETIAVAREKDITTQLMARYGIPFEVLAPVGVGRLGHVKELLLREAGMYRLARRCRPDVIAGTSVHAARISRLVGARSVVLCEDDAKYIPLFRWLAYPLAHAIVTPDSLAYENHGSRHFTYPAYQKLFYLHPHRFKPDDTVLSELSVSRNQPYALIRLSSLQAHHDVGACGLSEELVRRVIAMTSPAMRIFISSEKSLAPEFEPYRMPLPPERMHHVLAFADFLISDSQSMTVEGALLGVPAFKINSFAGIISVIRDLEAAGLAYGYRPGQEADLVRDLALVLALPDRKAIFQQRRENLLRRKIDPVDWFVELVHRMARRESNSAIQAWSRAYVEQALTSPNHRAPS